MTSPYTIFSTLPLLLLLLLLHPISNTSAATSATTNNLINQTCKTISKSDPLINPNFCTYALQSAPARRCVNLTRLGQISITLLKNNVTDTKCLIKHLLGDKKLNKKRKIGLRDCLEGYSNSLPTLKDAKNDYKSKRFDEFNVKVSSVLDSCTSCEDGFGDVKVVSPLTMENHYATQLSAISLSIVNMFHTSYYNINYYNTSYNVRNILRI